LNLTQYAFDLWDLMEQYGIKIDTKIMILKDDLSVIRQDFNQIYHDAVSFVDTDFNQMLSKLNNQLQSLDSEFHQIWIELEQDPYINPNENAKFVLKLLEEMETKLNVANKKEGLYQKWRNSFKKPNIP